MPDRAAGAYIASHLAEWGLKPGGSTTKTTGPLQPYFIPMELIGKQVVAEQSKASITAPVAAAGTRLRRWRCWRRWRWWNAQWGAGAGRAANRRL